MRGVCPSSSRYATRSRTTGLERSVPASGWVDRPRAGGTAPESAVSVPRARHDAPEAIRKLRVDRSISSGHLISASKWSTLRDALAHDYFMGSSRQGGRIRRVTDCTGSSRSRGTAAERGFRRVFSRADDRRPLTPRSRPRIVPLRDGHRASTDARKRRAHEGDCVMTAAPGL